MENLTERCVDLEGRKFGIGKTCYSLTAMSGHLRGKRKEGVKDSQ